MMREQKRCETCELGERRRLGNAPLWDCIHRTRHWDVAHAYNTSLPSDSILATGSVPMKCVSALLGMLISSSQ